MNTPSATIADLIATQAVRTPDALALGAPGRGSLTSRRLQEHVAASAEMLAARGVGRSDCIAIVLPAGAELATAVLAVAEVGIAAPLNPAYTTREFALHIERLRPAALLVQGGTTSPALR